MNLTIKYERKKKIFGKQFLVPFQPLIIGKICLKSKEFINDLRKIGIKFQSIF